MALQRRDVTDIMIGGGLVPVFNHDDAELAQQVVKTCYDAGLRVFEWTNRSDQAFRVFGHLKDFVRDACPGLRLGAGSILDPEVAERYVAKGAEFLVSPVFDPDLARFAQEADVTFIPGCGSVTEIHQAQKYGATLVKIFPGNVLGPEFVQAVLGPMPWTRMMPTGGVSTDRDNLERWFRSGVACVGMGSGLFKKEWMNEQGMGMIRELVEGVMGVIGGMRD